MAARRGCSASVELPAHIERIKKELADHRKSASA